jgi:carboxypeptidase Taq
MHEINALQSHLSEIKALAEAAAVLDWDQQTYMPPGGAESRAAQLGALSKVIHEKTTGANTERLLECAEDAARDADPDSDDAALVRAARRDFSQATKVPTTLVAELARTTTLAHEHWAQARAASDYSKFAPWLSRILDLTRQEADFLGHGGERYDALLDQYEPGTTTAEVRALFDAIKPTTVALVKSIPKLGPEALDASVLTRDYAEAAQQAFGETVIKALGYDFQRGRQDRALHPFCTSFGAGDVRITTRFDRNFLPAALFGSIHETGHALYEQGLTTRYPGGGLGEAASLGIHESQSRLWENLVGRSRPFWHYWYPNLQAAFPDALQRTSENEFYRAINKVEPSLIRVEADEVTYNLHILLRFEMEVDLLSGALSVADAPAAWNSKMEQYFGLIPPDDASGILQDVHWSAGLIGYFPTYTLGNLLSVQLYAKADEDLGGQLASQIARGDFAPLLGWLRENVHQWGRKYLPKDLMHRAAGGPLDPAPYLRYLQAKFGEIYGFK